MYHSEQRITTSPYTTVYYIKVVVGTNLKGKVSSSFHSGFGPQAVVILLWLPYVHLEIVSLSGQ